MLRAKFIWMFNALLITGLSFYSLSSSAQQKPLSDLVAGGYPKLSQVLGEQTYETEVMTKLAHPTLIYIDENWLIEKGYDVPSQLTPAFEKKILETLAYAVPIRGEPKSAYKSETKTFYSDYYGGFGMDGNIGSGRAASRGEIQIKGGGPTKMVRASVKLDPEHSNGLMDFNDGFEETLTSQIANNELPFGANRVIALIATGTTAVVDGERVERTIVVREDPLRPGHFIPNELLKDGAKEKARIDFVMSTVDQALPQPAGVHPATREERLESGIHELLDRHAKVAAYSYANRFLHSALSPSNEEMSGAALDFGAFMALDGYPKAGRVDDNELNGDTNSYRKVLKEFIVSLRNELPRRLRDHVPTAKTALDTFEELHLKYLRHDMLLLTGAPPELLNELNIKSHHELADLLVTVSKSGNDKIFDALNDTIERTGHYDIPRILTKMANTLAVMPPGFHGKGLHRELDSILRSEILDESVRGALVKGYVNLVADLATHAKNHQIGIPALQRYIMFAADIRNRNTIQLLTSGLRAEFWGTKLETYFENGRVAPLRKAMTDAIQSSRRVFKNVEPFTLVVRETKTGFGESERLVFDLRTGETSTVKFHSRPERQAAPSAKPVTAQMCREIFS